MAKYRKFDPKNKKQSKDKRSKYGKGTRIHRVDHAERIDKNELTKVAASLVVQH